MVWELFAGQALNAGLGAWASNRAANAQERAADQMADTSRRGMVSNLMLQEPWRQSGYQALNDINRLYGYSTPAYQTIADIQRPQRALGSREIKNMLARGVTLQEIAQMGQLGDLTKKGYKRLAGAGLSPQDIMMLQSGQPQGGLDAPQQAAQQGESQPGAGNMDRFFTSPDYQFRQQEGSRAIQQSAAARGGHLGGNAQRALVDYSSNLASGEFGNYFSRLMQVATGGQAAANNAGNAVTNNTVAQMGAQQAAGDARASGVMGIANSVGSAVNSGLGLYALQQYLRQPQTPQPSGFMPQPGMGIIKLPGQP